MDISTIIVENVMRLSIQGIIDVQNVNPTNYEYNKIGKSKDLPFFVEKILVYFFKNHHRIVTEHSFYFEVQTI